MQSKLLIVESPNKIKKISSILDDNWIVKASVGHIRDLPMNSLGVDRSNDYSPKYEVYEDKKQVVANLYRAVKEVGLDNVYLATDPDREGEAIAFHLCKTLGLQTQTAKRVTFNEITKEAVNLAVNKPRNLDMNLVSAQEARRVIDRLSGFEVTEMLNRKIGSQGGFLTAGRVQSVALKLAVEREKEIENFASKIKYKLVARFLGADSSTLEARFAGDLESKEAVNYHFSKLKNSKFIIKSIDNKNERESPPAPFTTSSLQQVAIKKYKWSASKVMEVAQKLFENGHITYMRTDSPNLSEQAIDQIRDYLVEKGRLQDFQKRLYKSKGNAQEAHEAIRPTHFENNTISENPDEQKLYLLIYIRSIASQMVDAIYSIQTIEIEDITYGDIYIASAKTLIEAGFKMYYNVDQENDAPDKNLLAGKFESGQSLKMANMICKGVFANPPKRYDEAGLVKALEDRGIGRPSTYANIIFNIIEKRKYLIEGDVAPVIKEIDVFRIDHDFAKSTAKEPFKFGGGKNVLLPQINGISIVNFLNERFEKMVDYSFTSEIEEKLDLICEGKISYVNVVSNFDLLHTKCLTDCDTLADSPTSKKKSIELGLYKNLPVKLGSNEKGSFLIFNEKFYSVNTENISLSVAIVEIDRQDKARTESIIKSVGQYTIKIGKFGFYFTDQKSNTFPVKKGLDLEAVKALNVDQLKEMAINYKQWKAKQAKK